MAENIPPPDNTRGVPYYEKLKRDLRETLQKKRLLDKNMVSLPIQYPPNIAHLLTSSPLSQATLEDQIFRYEASYLEETGAGNIIKGFDNYIKGSSTTAGTTNANAGGGTNTRRKGQVLESDRVFSRSSAGFMRELSPTSSAHTTPSHAPTPTSGNLNGPLSGRESNHATPTNSTSMKAGQNNKKKKGGKEEEENDGRGPKRLKITYARGGVGD